MKTLSELSAALVALDEEMDAEAFDPAQIVGDIKDKVDGIKWKIDQWKAQVNAIQENWIDPLTNRKKTLQKKIDKLEEYCAFVLRRDQIEMLPGNAFSLKLRQSDSVEVDVDPTPVQALELNDLVRTKISYAWDKKKLAEKLKANEQLNFCRLVKNYSVNFVVRKDQ